MKDTMTDPPPDSKENNLKKAAIKAFWKIIGPGILREINNRKSSCEKPNKEALDRYIQELMKRSQKKSWKTKELKYFMTFPKGK